MRNPLPAPAVTPRSVPWLFLAASAGCAIVFASLLWAMPQVIAGLHLQASWPWVPAIGVDLSFHLDGLALLFALIISGIGSLIFFYSAQYFKNTVDGRRICLILVLFMLAMLGLVLADNLICLFVFWELTTITSYLLIGTKHEDEKARKLALQALLVTGLGGLVFLSGLILLGQMAGTYSLSTIITNDFTNHPQYTLVFLLILAGCITKSALFPFHFWLPNAMAAPTPISAYLHSATMVKAGLYILARLHPALSGTDTWFFTLAILGGITAVWSSVLALRQTDLKLMLAYTTVMALGTIALFLAGSSNLAVLAALTFLLVHALYKASLFLVVANIEKSSGTRDWRSVSGLGNMIPLTALAAILSGLSMAGIPPLLGFIAKELQLEAALAMPSHTMLVTSAVIAAAFMMAGVAFFLMRTPFFGKPAQNANRISWMLSLPPLLLAIISLIAGLLPLLFTEPLVHAAARSLNGIDATYPALKLWHGVNLPLQLSAIAITLGLLLAWQFQRLSPRLDAGLAHLPYSCERGYEHLLSGSLAFARWQIGILQNGRQRAYVMTVFLTLSSLLGLTALAYPTIWDLDISWPDGVPIYQWLLCFTILTGVVTAVFSNSRLLAICGLGVIGTGIALLFVIYSAPDVAMTQFMTEILIVIILAIVILRLPSFPREQRQSTPSRMRDGLVAVISGGFVTLLLLNMIATPFDNTISDYYIANSYPQALGRNIVNVILVDFRAVDTMGEILVVAIAGLTCLALVKLRAKGSTN